MNTTLRIAAALSVTLLTTTAGEARRYHHNQPSGPACDNDGRCVAGGGPAIERQPRRAARSHQPRRVSSREAGSTTILGGRPQACHRFPKTARRWCGCAAAIDRGMDNRDGRWNLASNWFKLPRTSPASGMVAVRHGHVSVLRSHLGGSIWMAYDPNSGQQLARLHPIDLRRFRAVVNPNGARLASRPPPAAKPTVETPSEPPPLPAAPAVIASADPEALVLAAEPRKASLRPSYGESGPGPSGPPLRGIRVTSASPEIVMAIEDARDTLIRTATAGGTMLKHGIRTTIEKMQPVFVVRLSRAIEEARADPTVCSWTSVRRLGPIKIRTTVTERCLARVGCYSGYRQPDDGVGGYRDKADSNHAYGLACDMYGIGRPGSKAANLWHTIATKHGLYNPYGTSHRAEWNHYQATPAVKAVARVPELRKTITGKGPKDVVAMWRVADRALYLPEEKARSRARGKKIRYAKKHRRVASL